MKRMLCLISYQLLPMLKSVDLQGKIVTGDAMLAQ
jgi:hypothetical protein